MFLWLLLLISSLALAADSTTVPIFRDVMLHFSPDSSQKYSGQNMTVTDNGRMVSVQVELPALSVPHRIRALLTLKPTVKDERTVHDRYDRAGNICLIQEGKPDLEIVRFMTSYGGRTEHEVDVSYLSPVLRGRVTLRAFVDTWSSPGWQLDFSLKFVPDTAYDMPNWVEPIYYSNSFNAHDMPAGAVVSVAIPDSFARVAMIYTSTGHCTDGVDADEFISKANVIRVDNLVVERYWPWRTDCREYRELNPYCARWTDGSWSSDYSRCGWCPGKEVVPHEIDLTDHFSLGTHEIKFDVENMRPKNEKGDHGYWRVSAYLVGW